MSKFNINIITNKDVNIKIMNETGKMEDEVNNSEATTIMEENHIEDSTITDDMVNPIKEATIINQDNVMTIICVCSVTSHKNNSIKSSSNLIKIKDVSKKLLINNLIKNSKITWPKVKEKENKVSMIQLKII